MTVRSLVGLPAINALEQPISGATGAFFDDPIFPGNDFGIDPTPNPFANGKGPNGTFLMTDFLGTTAGDPHRDFFPTELELLAKNIYAGPPGPLDDLINIYGRMRDTLLRLYNAPRVRAYWSPEYIEQGQSSTFYWEALTATYVNLSGAAGNLPDQATSGSITVTFNTAGTYSATADAFRYVEFEIWRGTYSQTTNTTAPPAAVTVVPPPPPAPAPPPPPPPPPSPIPSLSPLRIEYVTGPAAGSYNSYDSALQALIAVGEAEIVTAGAAIDPAEMLTMDDYWWRMAFHTFVFEPSNQATAEIDFATIPTPSQMSLTTFVLSLDQYGRNTAAGQSAEYLQSIATTAFTGQATQGCLIEGRNEESLDSLDLNRFNEVPDQPITPPPRADLRDDSYSVAEARAIVQANLRRQNLS